MQCKARGVFLTLVAVVAMSAVMASAAFAAEPEFKPGTKQAFTGTSGVLTMESSAAKVTCSKSTSSGEITGASTVGAVVLTLAECKIEQGGNSTPLTSVGARHQGEIVTNALDGELGEVATSEATTGVGLVLKPASGKDWAIVEGPITSALEGSVAAEVTPVKTSAKTLKLVFAGSAGKSHIKRVDVKGVDKEPKLTFMENGPWSWNTTDAFEFKSNALEVT